MYGFIRSISARPGKSPIAVVHARRRAAVDERAAVLQHEVGRHAAPARVEEEVVGRREDAADRDVGLAVLLDRVLVGVDRVEALDRRAVRLGVRAEDARRARGRACRAATFIVQSRPHIVATSSMSERIGPAYGAVVRLRRRDEGAVVRLDRLVGDDAGQDQLAAAARAPVVRLRLADRDLDVALARPPCAATPACRARRRRRTCRPRRCAGRSGRTGCPCAPCARGSRGRSSARCRTPTSGRPCRSRRSRRRPSMPAASSASKHRRQQLRLRRRPELVVDHDRDARRRRRSAREKRGPDCGDSSAVRARPRSRRRRRRLVGVDRGEQVAPGDLELELVPVDLRRRRRRRRW